MEPSNYGDSPALTQVLQQWQQAWAPIVDFDMGETEEPPSTDDYQRYEDSERRALAGILTATPDEMAISIEQHDAPRPDPS